VRDAFGAPYVGKVWPGPCVFPDFTRPDVRAWWAGLYRDFMARGIDGVWNDMNEPAVFGVPGKTMPPHNRHLGGPADGDLPPLEPGPHARYHNVYGMLEVRASREGILAANPGKRPFLLTRANFLGGQRYAATWTGDNASTWEHLRLSVPMSLNLGLSGQPFNGPDIGGFNATATPELWGHWISMGAFFPFARAHAREKNQFKEPWSFGPGVEAAARTALERRYRLLPYYYTLFRESSLDGMPVMRPVFFADPRDPSLRAEDGAFLVGADLLVVPKWAKNAALPKGIWREISLVGENFEQDKYQASLKIRGGAIIPLGRVVQNTTEESLAPLTLLVCLDAQGAATGRLYEDAGDGFAYREGDYLLTTYRAVSDPSGDTVTVTITATEGARPRPERKLVVELITGTGVRTAEGRDGQPVQVRR
jgi:alpha-glucosidase